MSSRKVALCLPGGGATGAMYQIGALAALEDGVEDLEERGFDLYVGASSGASVASALAGGGSPRRIYRAFLDPSDTYFPLERKHLLSMDFREWRRTASAVLQTFRHGTSSLFSRASQPSPAQLWEELDRLYDTLPAGFFSLDRYERFLEDFFVRRGIPSSFALMPKPLRVVAHDLDAGRAVSFGSPGHDYPPVSRACIASMALPPFFSPVRMDERHYIDAGAAQTALLETALTEGATVLIVVNAMVPVDAGSVPTGHGTKSSVRDKGFMWVMNQALRIGMHQLMGERCARIASEGRAEVLVIEPDASDAILFMYNPASFGARRKILEHAYRTTRARLDAWLAEPHAACKAAGWRAVGG